MKIFAITSAFIIAIVSSFLHAEEFGTTADAEAMVKKAIGHIKSVGADTAYSDFTGQSPDFIKNDVYVVVYSMGGKALAHGQNPKQVGKELIDFKDADGKEFIKERVQLAKSKGNFWQDYKFTDPVTKKILPKSAYCEKVDETIVCAGIYKR
ncbi:cache domain-containing protein [Cellvibrio sp.]|jgi:signal transduction histidine kinase